MQCYKFLFIFVRLWHSFFLLLNPFPLIPIASLKIVFPPSPCNTWQTIPLFGGSSRSPLPSLKHLNYVSFSPLATASPPNHLQIISRDKRIPSPLFFHLSWIFYFIPPCLSPIKSRIVHLLDSVNELYFRDPIYFAFYRASSEIVRSIILYIPITVMGILIIWNPISRLDAGEHVAFPILDFMMHRRQKRCSG